MLVGLNKRWCVGDGYAVNQALGRMHRFLLNAPANKQVDHINGDKLDNRRDNLRLCSATQNAHNRGKYVGKSVFKGVTWQKRTYDESRGYWKAQIIVDGKVIYLGSYPTDRDAAAAYNDAATKHFGEFARLNDLTLTASNLKSSERLQVARSSPSGFKGVTFDTARNRWMAQLVFKGVTYLKKRFKTAEEAARAYDVSAHEVFGSSATTNFKDYQHG